MSGRGHQENARRKRSKPRNARQRYALRLKELRIPRSWNPVIGVEMDLARRGFRILRQKMSREELSDSPIGKWARVTNHGTIKPGHLGEVSIAMGTGVEFFYAKDEADGIIAPKAEVVVVDYEPPRTVIVSQAEGREEELWH